MNTFNELSRGDVEVRGIVPSIHPLLEQFEGLPPRQVFQKLLISAGEKNALSVICKATLLNSTQN